MELLLSQCCIDPLDCIVLVVADWPCPLTFVSLYALLESFTALHVTNVLGNYLYQLFKEGISTLYATLFYTVPQKNVPTLASCGFGIHGLFWIILGKQHQQTFKKYMHIQLSLFICTYCITIFTFK